MELLIVHFGSFIGSIFWTAIEEECKSGGAIVVENACRRYMYTRLA
jgi:hypothetical protein